MEKKGYTETLEWLQKLYPDRATISVKEAAKAMDASDRTVYDAVKRRYNPLPSQKLTRKKIVIPLPAFAKWLCC